MSVLNSRAHFMEIAEVYSYNQIPIFKLFGMPQFDSQLFNLMLVGLAIALIHAACGVFSRPALWVSTVLWFFTMGHLESYLLIEGMTGDSYNHSVVFVVLLILSSAKGIDRWDFQRKSQWRTTDYPDKVGGEVEIIKIYLGLVYFLSFYHKTKYGFSWLDGYSQQAVLFRKAVQWNLPFSLELSRHFYLAYFAGFMTLVLEGGFLLGQFFRPTKWFFVILGLGFHAANFFLMKIDFLNYFCFVYFIFAGDILIPVGKKLFPRLREGRWRH